MNKKELLVEELKKVWGKDQKMVDYCTKKAACIVELDNGDIATIDKPDIETSFCFGHGYCGVSTQEDESRAYRMEEHARTQESYFLHENLKGIDETIKDLQDTDNYFYKVTKYNRAGADSKYKEIIISDWRHNMENEPWRYNCYGKVDVLTDAERKAYLDGYKEVRKGFEKRLHTYLKRYGLSKLNTWTYLVD